MQFRCYSCGLVFHNGLPPVEALSTEQLEIVGEEPTIQHNLLFGTKFEGMSTTNFCAFCLTTIRDFPLAMENKHCTPGHKMQFARADDGRSIMRCECGQEYYPHKAHNDVAINRAMYMHLIDIFYLDADKSEINALFNVHV